MTQHLYAVEEVAAMIRAGRALLLAGDEAVLRQLPRGAWIGGTIPYFVTESGGLECRDRIFVDELPAGLRCAGIRRYGEGDIASVYADLPGDALGIMIAPASSGVHLAFATGAPGYARFAARPLIGWIAGVHLSEIGKATARVFDGTAAKPLDQEAVVMHVGLPPGKTAEIGTVNIFTEGEGPAIFFPETGFGATQAEVDGRTRNLAQYVKEAGIDTRLPLVADYGGTRVNVSFQSVDPAAGQVRFYAPVFPGVPYRAARPIADYAAAFEASVPADLAPRIAFSCNCILNYVHGKLEHRRTGNVVGPVTFGEIAYQLLNQTMVYVTIEDAAR